MENASKALIIAGAILLSILIIGLGMMVFNNAKNVLTSANLDQEQIDAFNSKFESYIGLNKRGTDVRTLCNTVKNSNAVEDENKITMVYEGNGSFSNGVQSQTDILKLRNTLKNGQRYDLEAEYDEKGTKLMNKIIIKDHKTTSSTPTE